MDYKVFEHFAYACGVDIQVFNLAGETLFASPSGLTGFTSLLFEMLDCAGAERMSLLYSVYQARRFGGRYAFIAPSGLTYCASPITAGGELTAGAVVGPFLMVDYEEYLSIDIVDRHRPGEGALNALRAGIVNVPIITPTQARAINEQLFICTIYYERLPGLIPIPGENLSRFARIFVPNQGSADDAGQDGPLGGADAELGQKDRKDDRFLPGIGIRAPVQATALAYPLGKEDDLLAAVSRGDIRFASQVLNDILGQILFHSGNDMEILRARVFELIVLLSRAALKGGANIDAIFGLKYEILREIDALATADDIGPWLHGVTRRFGQHVFDSAGTKRSDIIHKAIDYVNTHYMKRVTLQDIADHVFLSPTYFSKVFKDETGQTPIGFLTTVRIEAGKRLLRDPGVNISDIPGLVGFEDQSYFTRVFKKMENLTPADYRKKGQR